LQVEGHTNQAPGKPKYYDSDWDLATARAITVLRHLNERRGISEDRLAAVGFGHIKPLVDPATAGSQKLNKRVDIVVMSRLAEGSSQLLDRVVYDRAHGAAGAENTTTSTGAGNSGTTPAATEEH
jgi:chemotaxis protein MotB